MLDQERLADDSATLFTIWQRVDFVEDVLVGLEFNRRRLNDTCALSIRKIDGTSPPVYYYELKETFVTDDRDTFGIRRTNKTLGIHFTSITGQSRGHEIRGDVNTARCSVGFDCNNAEANVLPLFSPVFGKYNKFAC